MVKLICTLTDHSDDVNYCAFSSSYLATCSLDKSIRLYSSSSFDELPYSPLRGHTYAVHCCCFSPSGNLLASCSTDGNTILWETHSGLKLAVLEHPCRHPVRICRFSPDSTYLVSGAADGSVNLWNSQSLKVHRSGSVKDGSLVACAFAPNASFFVTGSSCGDITVWDETMRCLYNEKAHDLGVTCCDFSSKPASGNKQDVTYFLMASSGQDSTIKIWLISLADYGGLELKCKYALKGHTAPVLACAFSCDGQILVSGYSVGSLRHWHLEQLVPNTVLILPVFFHSLEVSKEDRVPYVSVRSVDKTVMIFETNTGNTLHVLTQHTRYVTTCAFAPDVPLFATGSMDKCVNIWQFEPKQLLKERSAIEEPKISAESWSEEEVSAWLCKHGLQDLVEIFKRNNIDGKELLSLTKESLADDLKIESLGLRSKVLRSIEELRTEMKTACLGIPDEFLCPITRELMKDPVIAADGYSYEKEAMEKWISEKRYSSPMTNLPLQRRILTPNRTLKMAIDRWLETQPKYNEKPKQ